MLSTNSEFLYISLFIGIAAIIVTYIVHFVTRSIKFAKYIPGLAMVAIGLFAFFGAMGSAFNHDSINVFLVAMLGIGVGLISLCFALILGIINKKPSSAGKSSKHYDDSAEVDY